VLNVTGPLLPSMFASWPTWEQQYQGRRKQCEAAGAAISKGHLHFSHHISERQYFSKLYCIRMDTRLLVLCLLCMGRQTLTLILNSFIRCTVLMMRNKISKRTYIAWFSINFTATG
jgi:hypothetical protein